MNLMVPFAARCKLADFSGTNFANIDWDDIPFLRVEHWERDDAAHCLEDLIHPYQPGISEWDQVSASKRMGRVRKVFPCCEVETMEYIQQGCFADLGYIKTSNYV